MRVEDAHEVVGCACRRRFSVLAAGAQPRDLTRVDRSQLPSIDEVQQWHARVRRGRYPTQRLDLRPLVHIRMAGFERLVAGVRGQANPRGELWRQVRIGVFTNMPATT